MEVCIACINLEKLVNVVTCCFGRFVVYNLGQKVLRILHFLSHRTPIPRTWYRYGPSPLPHPCGSYLVWIRNDPALTAVKRKSMRNAHVPGPGRGNFPREILIETIAETVVRQSTV